MSIFRLIIIGILLAGLTVVSSGQESRALAPVLQTIALHADTVLPYSLIPITVTDNGAYSETDTFGVHTRATYCIDGKLEPWLLETQFPPKPPTGVFDFRFTEHRSGSTCMLTGLKVHLQEPGKLDTFKLEFQPGEGGWPMRISWKDAVGRIAADWETLVLKDAWGGLLGIDVDMKVDTSIVIENDLINTLFIIGRSVPLGPRFLINATAGIGGTIQPGGTVYADSGGSRSFTITPSPGYVIGSVFVDSVDLGPVGEYEFTNVASNHTIHANFTLNGYLITASAGAGGTISPSGAVGVTAGANQTFTVQASTGFRIVNVVVDGVSQGPLAQYAFTNVTANHTINATFAVNSYQIAASAGPGGTISPSGTVGVTAGANRTFVVQASTGFRIVSVVVDSVSQGPLAQYTFTNVTANHTIRATFAANDHQIEASAGTGGTISPNGTVGVAAGANQTFIVQPSAGYRIDNVLVDSLSQGAVAQYTFTNVTANHTIRATFAVVEYLIDASAGAGGTITPNGQVRIQGGSNLTFIVQAAPGFQTDHVIIDGVSHGPLTQYSFTNISANHTIRATFTTDGYQLTASAGIGGTISPVGTVRVQPGGSQTFVVQASAGYQTDRIFIDGVSAGTLAQYSFTNVDASHTIHATFKATQFLITSSAGNGGTISPYGVVSVLPGGNQTFIVQAFPGYQTESVTVDGISYGPLAGYSFTNVSRGHVISVAFTPSGGGGGSIIVPITGRDAGTGIGFGTFGVHPNATYCLDRDAVPNLVERELPPKPPAGVFDLRFTEHRTGSACMGAGTKLHLQETGKLDTFKIEIQAGAGGYPLTLSWPAGLDSAWTSLAVRDIFGGNLVNVNMLTGTSLVLTNPLLNSLLIVGRVGSTSEKFYIDAGAGPGGSIAPQGLVAVDSGATRIFVALPLPGFVVDSISVDGARVDETSIYTFFDVAADHSIRVDFKPGARSGAGLGYRTFTASDLAIRTPNTKKPLYYRFSFRLINTTPQAATDLRIDFGGSASTVIEIENRSPFTSATTTDGKSWTFSGAIVAPGDTVVISGTNLRRPANIHRWNWIHNGLTGEIHGRFAPTGQRTIYPMPNAANVREELFLGGFGGNGLTVGVPRADSALYYGWVRMERGSHLQRSLAQRDRVHGGVARCFDFVRQKKTLTPLVQDNVMFANQAALKFNLRMSLLGVTPAGLRSIVFQDTAANPLDGLTIEQIAEYADSLLSGYYIGAVHVCESVALLAQVNGSIERINSAFSGPIDTITYASGTVLAGVREIAEVPFLRANPVMDTVVMQWDRSGPLVPAPSALKLIGNYPNPFNPSTTIRFSLPDDAIVSAVVYDQLGRQVAVLHDNEYLTQGEQETDFNASGLPSGLYFCRVSIRTSGDPDEGIEGDTETAIVRMLLVK